jgi:hypothetical protein
MRAGCGEFSEKISKIAGLGTVFALSHLYPPLSFPCLISGLSYLERLTFSFSRVFPGQGLISTGNEPETMTNVRGLGQ